ncbi:MAG: hypothetical protein AB3N24_15875 [Leisingera sp.]
MLGIFARSMFTATRISQPPARDTKPADPDRKDRWAAPDHWIRHSTHGQDRATR